MAAPYIRVLVLVAFFNAVFEALRKTLLAQGTYTHIIIDFRYS